MGGAEGKVVMVMMEVRAIAMAMARRRTRTRTWLPDKSRQGPEADGTGNRVPAVEMQVETGNSEEKIHAKRVREIQ